MESEEKCRRLAVRLQEVLSDGISLNEDVIHYIDSTFSNPNEAELKAILQDDTNCEKDSLMELLFFPDESMQLRLETLLERLLFTAAEEKSAVDYLLREPLQVMFRFPEDRKSLNLTVTEDTACQFIARLNVSKHLHPDLHDVLDHYEDQNISNRIKVKIRNSRFRPTEDRIAFLCLFFKKFDPKDNDIFECLEFTFVFLDEPEQLKNPYQALMAKKKFYFISLQKAIQLETQLKKDNIETLLAQGKRVVLIDQKDARKKMRIIDRISRAIYGKTEYFEPLHDAQDLIELNSSRNPEDIIRFLS